MSPIVAAHVDTGSPGLPLTEPFGQIWSTISYIQVTPVFQRRAGSFKHASCMEVSTSGAIVSKNRDFSKKYKDIEDVQK